jgi:hypothetical protein
MRKLIFAAALTFVCSTANPQSFNGSINGQPFNGYLNNGPQGFAAGFANGLNNSRQVGGGLLGIIGGNNIISQISR